ncbi:MAG: hypothetical protein AMS27_17750 [Bacteroides sp. SM23_62_1]|nr:MAG: hypothetical protein AMS27_17750 [Bacteroides sp. SM23_62_1]
MDLNNIFEGNLFKNGSFGIYWRGNGNDRDSVSIEVIGNDFQDQSEAAMDLWNIKTPVISGNRIRGKSTDPSGSYDYGIRINQVYGFPGHEALISNNFIFFEMRYSNNYYFPIYITNARYFDIFHNSINITKIPGNLYNYIFDPLKIGSVDHFRIMNNIFVNLVYDHFITYETEDDFQSDYNNFYGGEGVFDLAAWQASSGQDAHSMSVDPRFVASDDLHVAHPFLNGAGTPLDRVTTDIDGEPRNPANPDIGADEFEPGPAMAGTYTINPAGGDFNSFTEAVDTMYHNSLAGPVIFDVANGIYNEQIHLHDIPGSSETNTITFRSASADSTTVTLTFDANSAGNNYTLKLDGVQAVTFRDMTLSATDPVFSRVVAMTNAPSGNRFLNNRIIGVPGSSELIWSDATSDSNNVYSGNVFSGGDYGLYLEGKEYDQAGSPAGTEITGNYFQDQAESAIYLKFHKQPLVESNLIESDSTCTGISLFYPFDFFTVSKNRIHLRNSGNGIENLYGVYTDTGLISNNHIFIYDTLGANGIYTNSDFARLRIMHNSVHISGRHSGSNALHIYYLCNPYVELYNNILSNRAFGRAIQNRVDKSDYNDLFTNGEYLAYTEKTLEKWQTAYNLDINSVSAPPYFYPDTSYLCFNPLLNNAGTPLDEVPDDIEGETRDLLTPDIGADEFDLDGAPLSGNYTIGTGGDYLDFAGAVADLAGRGISGAVNFEVKTGTYKEQVFIPEVAGASETNTVTFRSESGDSSDVLLTFSPLGLDSRLRCVLMLDGTDHLILEHISISTGEDFGWPLYLSGEATGNVISNNRLFYGKTTSANDNDRALIYSSGSLDSNNLFAFNRLENAPVGMAILASSTGDSITGTRIRNNVFRNIGYRGIHLSYHDDFEISGNDVEVKEGSYNYGILTDNSRGMVFNNFVRLATTNGGKGIYLTGSGYAVYHNTVKITGSTSNSESLFLSSSGSISMNNVLVNLAGGKSAYYDTTELNSDYNLYYTTGSLMITATGSIHSSDIEEWQTESSGRDLHSISREPQFLADTNLHTTDPWLNNIGTPLAEVTTDIDGEPRDPAYPDPGADEFEGIMPFAGEYTIGPSGDFATFTDAVDTIAPVGLMGPVIFIVESGTYNEQFVIPEIPEISETNTITFKSASGDSTDVILGFKATISENYTVKLDGAKYIIFQDMTIKALDTAYTRVVEFANGASNNVIANNVIVGGGTENAAIFSIGSNDNNNIFENNLIRDGKIGIQMVGESSVNREAGTQITGNIFDNQVSSPIYLTNQDVPIVMNNRIIHGQLNETSWAGIYLENVYGKWDTLGLFANNVVHVYTNYTAHGISIKNSNYLRFYHNSVHITGIADESRSFHHESGNNIHLTNNIFSNTAGGLALVTFNSGGLTSDYNDLYTDGNRFIYTDIWINDLQTWQNTYGKDPHSFSVNPMYYADTNLHVYQPLLNGSGIPLAVIDRDMDGESRDPVRPDIGADEFSEAHFTLMMEDTTICIGSQIEIDAGEGYDSYLWSTGETTRSITVDTTGIDQVYYRVTITHNTYNYMDSVQVSFTGPVVNLGPDAAYCTDGSVLLDAGTGAFTYLWSDMSTAQTLSVSTTGQYSVTITDTYGCTDADTVNITLNPLPDVTIITETDALRIDAPSIVTYQWYMDNNIIDMATASVYNPIQSGDYFVFVTDGNNCSNYSDTVHYEISTVETLWGSGLVNIYPNPATGSLFINFTGVTSPAKVQLLNIVGNVVYIQEINDPAHQSETRIDLTDLPEGIYFAVIQIDARRIVRKVIVE